MFCTFKYQVLRQTLQETQMNKTSLGWRYTGNLHSNLLVKFLSTASITPQMPMLHTTSGSLRKLMDRCWQRRSLVWNLVHFITLRCKHAPRKVGDHCQTKKVPLHCQVSGAVFLDSFWRVRQFIFINLEVQVNFFQADTPAAFTVLEYLLQNVVLLVGGSGWWGMSVSERCLFIDIPILD